MAWATLVGNIVLVVTGGAVRLTGSGLGCPTWPRCTDTSFTPHGALDVHSAIEFGNRTLTFVLTAIAIGTFVTALRSGRRELVRLALIVGLGIPAQAVIGGITVLTGLNPWIVSGHLLCSLAIIGVAVHYLITIDHPRTGWRRDRAAVLSALVFVVGWAVLYVGTVVTGSGPHAGDAAAARNGLDPLEMSQLHADLVFLLLGLTVGLRVTTPQDAPVRTAVRTLLGLQVAQGILGFVQYFAGLPILVVGLHMLGAALTSAGLAWVLVLGATRTDDRLSVDHNRAFAR